MANDCIFCKIAKKELPSTIIEETDDIVVIEDLHPQAPTHLLVIPKTHYSTLLECKDEALLGAMLAMANKVARKTGIDADGFRVVTNVKEGGGQIVFHIHMHVMGGRPLKEGMG